MIISSPHCSTDTARSGRRRALLASALLVASSAIALDVLASAPASADATTGSSYVAFGDSYSAGPGLNPPRTTETPCQSGNYPSQVNWPSDVATTLGLTSSFRDFSCSGATVVNSGTATAPSALSLAAEISKATAAVNPALGSGTKNVTVMMSGNDVWNGKTPHGSVSLAGAACLGNALSMNVANCSTAELATPSQWIQPSDISVAGLTQYLLPELYKIRHAAPNARILLVGYPTVIKSGDACTDNVNYPPVWDVQAAESTYADSVFAALNIAEDSFMHAQSTLAALGTNSAFVNLRPSTTAHGVCAGAAHWIEPIKLMTTTTYPYLALVPSSGHPNPAGMSGFAATVSTAMQP